MCNYHFLEYEFCNKCSVLIVIYLFFHRFIMNISVYFSLDFSVKFRF